jgi:hypothetical protein
MFMRPGDTCHDAPTADLPDSRKRRPYAAVGPAVANIPAPAMGRLRARAFDHTGAQYRGWIPIRKCLHLLTNAIRERQPCD